MKGHPSRFTLVKGQGGLGNRMLSVMTATLYSLIMKRRRTGSGIPAGLDHDSLDPDQ